MESGFALQVLLPLITALLMLGVGMSLSMADFRHLFRYPVPAVIGLTNQLLLLPLLAFLVVAVFSPPTELGIGLIVLAAAPSASTSNLFTYLARGDTALSVSLTAASKLLAVVTLPLFVNTGLAIFGGEDMAVSLSFLDTFWRLLLMILLPTTTGMIIRHHFPVFAHRSQGIVKRLSVAFLALLIVGLLVQKRDSIIPMLEAAGWLTLTLCLSSMLAGHGFARLFRLHERQRRAITIEGGMQSGGLAIVIASSILGSTTMAIPAAVYSLVMYLATGAYVAAALHWRYARSA